VSVQGDLLADEGAQRALDGAHEGWVRAAKHTLWQLCRQGEPFTSDAIWYRLEALGVSTSEPRALGAVVRAAVSAGYLTHSGEYFKSTRPECHSRPLSLYLPTAKCQERAA
jgi:hypothetical protein